MRIRTSAFWEVMDGFDVSDEPFIYRLNDNGTGPSLLVKVCAERGWRIYQGLNGSEERWNLWWRSSAFPVGCYKTLGDWQFMNHIPKGGSICRKDNLSRLLRCMRRIYGSIYDFSPPCYHLPLEYAKLVSECSRLRRDEGTTGSNVVWIHKPVAQSQGRGIFLFRSICEMSCGTAAVVQRYIERPLLIAGYKFDLRLYVCVPGYRPLTAYMYAEGLARFGTDTYTLSDIHNPYRHLTNSSLNKSGPRYAECKDRIGSGCKWTLKQVRRALLGRWGAAEWLVWQRIRAIVTLTLLAQAAGTPPARNCFEFYGFDILLDDSLKPWLIEVNLSPALGANCEADIIVKQPMLHELFDLLGLPMKHTGLALLQGPPSTPTTNTYSSEDENGPPRSATSASSRSGTAPRRGARVRRRRAMPIHCVNIHPPITDKLLDATEKNKDINSGRHKTTTETTSDTSDVQSTSSSAATPPAESSEETWRGGYSTAASRRRMMSACAWGNGVRWNQAVGRVGHWVRIYPHTLPKDDEMPMEDVRESVAQVSKLTRAAREVTRECTRDPHAPRDSARDACFESALQQKLNWPQFEGYDRYECYSVATIALNILSCEHKMNNDIRKVQPFDSFTAVCKILVWAGYYKPLNKPSTRLKQLAHQIYRLLVLLFTVVYNAQHLIFILQHRHDMEKLMDCLMIEIPQMNLFAKVFTMLVQTSRIDKVQELLNGAIFAATDEEDQLILQENTVEMRRLLNILNVGVTMSAILWPTSFFVKRYTDKNEMVNSYMPFETETWPAFSISVLLEIWPMLWIGYGHMSLDCLIAAYYAQARTQLKMIKHQLQKLYASNEKYVDSSKFNFQYIDLSDRTVHKRFIQVVKRYETLVWYKNEVDTAFNFSLSVQFLSTASAVCLVIYRMTFLSVTSFPFIFLALLFCILLTQVFMYCYYGNLVEFESSSVNVSVYESDWLSSSPSFRRLLLIAMTRWSQPIRPRVCGIIPLSINTFIQIVKSSYTLYTVLVVTAKQNNF